MRAGDDWAPRSGRRSIVQTLCGDRVLLARNNWTLVGPQPRGNPFVYTVTVGPYVIAFQSLETQEPPILYEWARPRAELDEEIDLHLSDGDFCYLVAGRSIDHPTLVLAQRHDPPEDAGFYPGSEDFRRAII